MTRSLAALVMLLSACVHRPWVQAAAGQRSLEIRPGQGVENLGLGMGPARIRRRLGAPRIEDRFENDEFYWTYPQLGLSVHFLDQRAVSFFCYSGLHGGYETRDYQPFPGATPEGVGVQADRAGILAVYGQPDRFEENQGAPIPAYWLTYDAGIGFCLTSREDRVVYLFVEEISDS